MQIGIDSTGGGGYLLVPAFLLPSNDCEHRYGLLQPCGQIVISDSATSVGWQRMLADGRSRRAALMMGATAHDMGRPDHQCLQRRRQPPGPLQRTTGILAQQAPANASARTR